MHAAILNVGVEVRDLWLTWGDIIFTIVIVSIVIINNYMLT